MWVFLDDTITDPTINGPFVLMEEANDIDYLDKDNYYAWIDPYYNFNLLDYLPDSVNGYLGA